MTADLARSSTYGTVNLIVSSDPPDARTWRALTIDPRFAEKPMVTWPAVPRWILRSLVAVCIATASATACSAQPLAGSASPDGSPPNPGSDASTSDPGYRTRGSILESPTTTTTIFVGSGTPEPATTLPAAPVTTISVPSSQSSPGAAQGGLATVPLPTSPQPIPAGTSDGDKAWCAQAKPVAQGLVAFFSLDRAQLEALVADALALEPSAPPTVQPHLIKLADTATRFIAAVAAGQATVSPQGIVQWAAQNLSPAEQQGFLTGAGDVISYISRTC